MTLVMDRVNTFSDEMLLHYAAPNRALLVGIMQLDAADLNQVYPGQLSQYVLVLGQYLVMLQYNENMKNIEHMLTAKTFEHKLNLEKFSREDVQGKTEKERRAWLLLQVPALHQLHEDVLVADAEKMVISGMVKAVEGLLNALKKELSGRHND